MIDEPTPLVVQIQPTVQQLQRAQALRRFNWLYLYLPLGLFGAVWIGLIGGMIWLTISGRWFAMETNATYYRQLYSGIADGVLILAMTPWLVICALPTLLAVALVINRGQKAQNEASRPEQLPLFWRVENSLDKFYGQIEKTLPKLARPVITAHALVSFLKTILNQIKQLIKRN